MKIIVFIIFLVLFSCSKKESKLITTKNSEDSLHLFEEDSEQNIVDSADVVMDDFLDGNQEEDIDSMEEDEMNREDYENSLERDANENQWDSR